MQTNNSTFVHETRTCTEDFDTLLLACNTVAIVKRQTISILGGYFVVAASVKACVICALCYCKLVVDVLNLTMH